MNGREKIREALSKEGAGEIPVVIPYEHIYIRDHWKELTSCPWWYREMPDMKLQMKWVEDVINRTGMDWWEVNPFVIWQGNWVKNKSI